jgi:predicted peroxiredoxin
MVYEKAYEKAYYEIRNEKLDEVLRGVVDIHIHAGPEVIPRKQDIFEVAREARDRGMKAIVCKPFTYCNAPLAKVAEQVTPGIRVFGGLTLDLAVGGYNPRAVDAAIKLGSKFIWGPVLDSAITVEKSLKVKWYQGISAMDEKTVLRPMDEKGRIKEEVKDILALIGEASNIIFGTGHQFPEDTMKLIEAAKEAGVKKFIVTHPHAPIIGATIEQQKEMIKLGAKLDYCWCNAMPYYDRTDPVEYAEAMKVLGPEHIIMSTDFGQPVNPSPAEGMANYILTMMTKGITKAEIDLMCRKNPAELLDL